MHEQRGTPDVSGDLRDLLKREQRGPSAREVYAAADVLRGVDLDHAKIEDLTPEQLDAARVLAWAADTDQRPTP